MDLWERRYRVTRQDVAGLTEAMLKIENMPHGDECPIAQRDMADRMLEIVSDECPRSNRKLSIVCSCHRIIARNALAKIGR